MKHFLQYTSLLRYILLLSVFFLFITCSNDDDNSGNGSSIPSEQVNENANDSGIAYATGLEVPHIDENNYFLPRTTTKNGKTILTYVMEYNAGKKHSKWVAFTFQADTRSTEWKRANWGSTEWGGDPFQPDPDIAEADRTTLNDYYYEWPYVRGHVLGSYDRVYSKDANYQTFFLSNISPMLSSFNSGDGSRWNDMELALQDLGRSALFCDTLFVVKGGTIRDGEIALGDENYLPLQAHGLTVPKYYFSAALCKKNGLYKAVAFWFEHKPQLTGSLKDYAISVNELERLTGIDFFCNLPDKVEESVEENVSLSAWKLE